MTRTEETGMPSCKAKTAVFLLFTAAMLIPASCHTRGTDQGVVTVSILPQKYFVERIAGEKITVQVMLQPGYSPESEEITSGQMKGITRSAVYFRIGPIPFEEANIDGFLDVNPLMKVVDTSAGIAFIKSSHTHIHKDSAKFSGIDPHIWVSTGCVKIMARNICTALKSRDPESAALYEKNLQSFTADIDSLDRWIAARLAPYRGRKFLVFHPAWSYFAQDYGLVQVPLESDGKSPGPAHIARIIDLAKKEKLRTIFIQSQFPNQLAAAIAKDIGGQVVSIDPLAEDWIAGMKAAVEAISSSMEH